MHVSVLNGPSLNLLGVREPSVYGTDTLQDIEARVRAVGSSLGVTLDFVQHNGEGALIDSIHALRGVADGAVVNAGAYTHTSLAVRDALTAVGVPFVEVHLSNIFAREPERRTSMLAGAAVGVVCGFGATSYELALRGLVDWLSRAR
ncbi:MAG TPA: type II 3-dehydroquinate dehydratase [Gemmatimonadaceae bacterium]|nr:type II 3-dehydroquinate dehydratase [Gemmatimonadaceae bacterium]